MRRFWIAGLLCGLAAAGAAAQEFGACCLRTGNCSVVTEEACMTYG